MPVVVTPLVAAALLLSAAPVAKKAEAPAVVSRGGVREVMLDPNKRLEAPEVSIAPGLATTLTFPEAWVSQPACGDCQYGDTKNEGQYWRLDIDPATNAISIKFIAAVASHMVTSPPVTNVNLQLESGLNVSLLVILTIDPKDSDLRVDFKLPAGAKGKEKLTQREKELEAAFAGRVAEAAEKSTLAALMTGTTCRKFAGGPRRNDMMVVRLDQLCRNGKYVYATFEVENRQRSDLALLTASLTSTSGATNVTRHGDAEVPLLLFEKEVLAFNERSKGIAAISLADTDVPPTTSYTLVVQEDGDKARAVSIEGIELSGGCSSAGAPSVAALGAVSAFALRRRRRRR